jgi:hypothetical protein
LEDGRSAFGGPGVRGWSVNISDARFDMWIDLPSQALFSTRAGPVIEIVFYSPKVSTWFHGVSEHFWRCLPSGHLQVTPGDMAWLRGMAQRHGSQIFSWCLAEFWLAQVPDGISLF